MITFLHSQSSWLFKTVKRFSMFVMILITLTSCMNAVRLKYFQAELYYSYQGTTGPYEVVDDNGIRVPGRLISTVTAGEAYGWVVDYCIERNIGADVELRLVRLAQDGLPEQTVDTRVVHYTPSDHRCGPIFGNWRVPEGVRPGSYEVRRKITFIEGVAFKVSKALEPVHLVVSAVAYPPAPIPQQSIEPAPISSQSRATSAVMRIYQK